tara:strand:+ start:2203 stop:2394 length:192 start_codon:yes stop_codon:yes gene_type:complete
MEYKVGDLVKDLSDGEMMIIAKIRQPSEDDPRRICCWSPKHSDFYWYDHEDMDYWLRVIECPG